MNTPVGNVSSSQFQQQLTNFGKNQTLQYEEIITFSMPLSATVSGGLPIRTGNIDIPYKDQTRSQAPQFIAFLDQGGGGVETLPIIELGSVLGEQLIKGFSVITAFTTYLNCNVVTGDLFNTFTFTVYILTQNTLI